MSLELIKAPPTLKPQLSREAVIFCASFPEFDFRKRKWRLYPAMVYSVSYLKEKFLQAVFDLATSDANLKSRVERARGRFWLIPNEDFPEDVREDRAKIETLVTQIDAKEGFVIPENFRLMTNETAAEIASLIVSIHYHLAKLPHDFP